MLALDKGFEHIPAQIQIFLLPFIETGRASHSYHLIVSVNKREHRSAQKQVKCTVIHQISTMIRKNSVQTYSTGLKGLLLRSDCDCSTLMD